MSPTSNPPIIEEFKKEFVVQEPPRTAHKGLSSNSMHARGKCVYQDDPKNVVSTQLEGSWEINQEITAVLSPSAHGPLGPAFKALKFERNETVLDILPPGACDKIDLIYFLGVMTIVSPDDIVDDNLICPFVLTNISGNPTVVAYSLEIGASLSFTAMMAKAENRMEDMFFITSDDNPTGEETFALKRID